MPQITVSSSKVHSLVSRIATHSWQYGNSKVSLQTFEPQLVLAYH